MSRILKTEPLPHVVICDTNMLWHEDKAVTVSPDFEAFWATLSQQFDLSLVIPEVVQGELLFQHCTSCNKLLKATEENLKKISAIAIAQHSIRLTHEKIRSQIEDKFEKWIRQHRAVVLPIPVAKIDWRQLTNAAIWRLPPFEADPKNPDFEKGFRDALIMETVCDFVQNDPRQANFVFLCNDQLLRNAVSARLKAESRFLAYERLKDFESYLNLTKQKLTNEFISKILSRARDKFFQKDDPASLISRAKFIERLKTEYGEYFEDVSKSERPSILALGFGTINQPWNAVSSGTFWVTNPEFIQIENEKVYHWKSVIRFIRLYTRITSPSRWPSLLTPPVEPAPPPAVSIEQRILLLPFNVTWSAMVKNDARFHDMEIVKIELVENEFRHPTDTEIKMYNLKVETTS